MKIMKIMKFVSITHLWLITLLMAGSFGGSGMAELEHSNGCGFLSKNDTEEGQRGMVEFEHSNGGRFLSKGDTNEGQSAVSLGCVNLEWPPIGTSDESPTLSTSDIPSNVDWRNEGAVNSVKKQGRCNSCWAFSAAGAIEGIVKIKTGDLLQLSVQELVDCDDRSNGCKKGRVSRALAYAIKMKGLAKDLSYPYKGKKGKCRSEGKDHIGQIDGYVRVHPTEEHLLHAVSIQPVSAIVSPQPGFVNYQGGIFAGPCEVKDPLTVKLWHAIIVVGYGTSKDGTTRYWILKNSWGTKWGEDGYMRLKMGGSAYPWGLCGIALSAVYPTLHLTTTSSL